MHKIFGIVFGTQKQYDAEYKNLSENIYEQVKEDFPKIRMENVMLKEKVAILSEGLSRFKKEPVSLIDPFVGDVEPKDSKERRLYVATIAGVYKDLLLPKWKKMIAELFKLLESSTNDRDFDLAIKGAIYAKREDILWGEKLVNEHVGNMSEGTSKE